MQNSGPLLIEFSIFNMEHLEITLGSTRGSSEIVLSGLLGSAECKPGSKSTAGSKWIC